LTNWSLAGLLQSVASEVERSLGDARTLIAHEGEKGGASEDVWRALLRRHLPLRYQVDTGFVVDNEGQFSEQIDIIVFDRQYSPLVFELGTRKIFPAESIYAVFEAKQSAGSKTVAAARRKAASVRRLKRTSLPILDLNGKPVAKPIQPILAGILALESDWNPPLGESFAKALAPKQDGEVLDIGCVAARGIIRTTEAGVEPQQCDHAATVFLLDLVARLQLLGTVPMLDMMAYARHLTK
jgi:hypothetical protein